MNANARKFLKPDKVICVARVGSACSNRCDVITANGA